MNLSKELKIPLFIIIALLTLFLVFVAGEYKGKSEAVELNNEYIDNIVSDRLGNVSQSLGNREARIDQLEEELEICMTPSNKIVQ